MRAGLPSLANPLINRLFLSQEALVRDRKLDVILALSLFLGALALRLPNLMLIPPFSDETIEILRSLSVSQGKLFPLTNADPYYGSVYNFMIAGVFYLFGPTAEHARLAMSTLGALTVPLAYFFIKTLEDRLTGLVGALMMLTSGALIVNGHVAWENEMTPFFATATFLALAVGLKYGNGLALVISGLLYGLTLQTHPGLIVLAPGLLLYFVLAGLLAPRSGSTRKLSGWLKSPWPYLALVAALVGYGNVIAQNLQQPLSSWIAAQKHTYAFETTPTDNSYLMNVQAYVMLVIRMAGSMFDARGTQFLLEFLLQPLNSLYLVLLLLGIIITVKRGNYLPVVVLVVTGLLLPYFNKSYGYPGAARYVGYLFPLLYLLIATPLAHALRTPHHRQSLRSHYFWLVALFIMVAPLLSLTGYYRNVQRSGPTNERVLAAYQLLRQEYLAGAVGEIVVDNKLGNNALGGGGNVQRALDFLCTLDGTPFRNLDLTADSLRNESVKAGGRRLAVVMSEETHQALASQMGLSPIEIKGVNAIRSNGQYGIYLTEGPRQ